MRLKIDRAGRIVVPKRIRDRLHLRPGTELALEESADSLLLRPVERRPSLVERDGVLIHLGQPPAGFDWGRLVEDEREERLRNLAGLK